MKRSYKERLNYELDRMTDRNRQKKFFAGAIDRMNYGYDEQKVIEQKEFACDVLCHCAFCLHVDCDHCRLEASYKKALEEIGLGMRMGYEKAEKVFKESEHYNM